MPDADQLRYTDLELARTEEAAIRVDLGDLDLIIKFKVKGLAPLPHLRLRVGVPRPTTEADRVIKSPTPFTHSEKVDIAMDLGADQQVPLSVEWTDEIGNPVDSPEGATYVYTVDDNTIIALTDNGDGTAMAAATGTLGTANVNLAATFNGQTLTGDLQIVVVAGLAERINIVAGEPEEVTPDS